MGVTDFHTNNNNDKDKIMRIPQKSLLLGFLLQITSLTTSFVVPVPSIKPSSSFSSSSLAAKATKKKKKKKNASGGGGGLKGFGGVGSSGSSKTGVDVDIDRSKEARAFYEFMEEGSAGDTLNRCAMGYFPLIGDTKLRGVVALKPMKKGDVIIRIPYELAVNLGQEGADPTGPAVTFLREYCQVLGGDGESTSATATAYYKMLPPFKGDDCLGSTDFFSDEALEALQSPLIVEETLKRKEKTLARFQSDIDESFPNWIDGTPVTVEHLQWAVWLITSRVLTVQGDEEEGKSFRLLIPFLDMCNHDRSSSHVLTGRAVPGGELKVVAGGTVKEGDQINICYGGGQVGNDRFVQDYGFLDGDDEAFNMVAKQLLGKRRIVEGIGAGRILSEPDREESLKLLRSTTIEEDVKLLDDEVDPGLRAAYMYRLNVKRALAKFIVMQ